MKYFSPAKINLFLRVLRKREDGYHDLASLFQAVDLCDLLEIQFSDVDRLQCSDPDLAVDRSNLVWKAVDLFRRKTNYLKALSISLKKKIPSLAGLGGGSSNAATTLFALNQLFQANIEEDELSKWASEIGSDISFFFSKGRAFCTGRGEEVKELGPVYEPSLWLVKPLQGLSTPLIFKHLNVSECSTFDPYQLLKQNQEGISLLNDLEKPAFALMPALHSLKNELQEQGFQVVMTGSGTGLLCFGKNKPMISDEHAIFLLKYLSRKPGEWYQV